MEMSEPEEGLNMDVHLEGGDDATRHGAVSLTGGTARLQGRLNFTRRQTDFDLSSNDAVIGSEDDKDDNKTLSGRLNAALTDNLSLSLSGRVAKRDTDTDGFDFLAWQRGFGTTTGASQSRVKDQRGNAARPSHPAMASAPHRLKIVSGFIGVHL